MIEGRLLYQLYETVIRAVNCTSGRHGLKLYLPATVSRFKEFASGESIEVSNGLFLSGSNSFEKQVAASYLGGTYSIASCHRLESPKPDRLNHFHQIEIELTGADLDECIAFAEGFLAELFDQIRSENIDYISNANPFVSFDRRDTRELLSGVPPARLRAEFEKLGSVVSSRSRQPTWLVYTPQSPVPYLNRTTPDGLFSFGFDLILPGEFGELISGGSRDKEQLESVLPGRAKRPVQETSGFGIGLERLVRFLLGAESVTDVVLPHFRSLL